MSIRNLDSLFQPQSLALIGASDKPNSLGTLILRNLKAGGFTGLIGLVNPNYSFIHEDCVWPTVSALPFTPDLAIICTPAHSIPSLIDELGRKGCRAAIVISTGLNAMVGGGDQVLTYGQLMLNAAQPYVMRILGPNCIGLLVPRIGLNASFAPSYALAGRLAFVSQSGALATAMLDWANERDIGFSCFISLGDSADIDFGDVLDYLAGDLNTKAVLMYAESISAARKFMSAARHCARIKPVVIVKSGRAPAGAKAAASHTHALAGSDVVIDAAFRRAGMLRVDTLEALFDASQTLAHGRAIQGERLAILTNGGGAGVLAADALQLQGGVLATLSQTTIQQLNDCLPAAWPQANPIDIIGDAPVERYQNALSILLTAPEVDAVLFIHAPTAIVDALAIAQFCVTTMTATHKPVLTCWLGGAAVYGARMATAQANLPTYNTPERAVMAWMQMVNYARNQAALQQLPIAILDTVVPDRIVAQGIFDQAIANHQQWLDGAAALQLLNAYGIPTVKTIPVKTVNDAVRAAHTIGYPVTLKIQSEKIIHKSDVGGVALNLLNENQVAQSGHRMQLQMQKLLVQEGEYSFIVQAMVDNKKSTELILGVNTDSVFGPVLMLGEGGVMVELKSGHAVSLPPMNVNLAMDLIHRSQLDPILKEYRGRPAADIKALLTTIMNVSQIASELSWVDELDINPLLLNANGIIAVDARVKLREPDVNSDMRLAIKPYPYALEEQIDIAGQTFIVRPIQPQDGTALMNLYADVSSHATDMGVRLFYSRGASPKLEIARYSQIDYDREMTFVVLSADQSADRRIVAEIWSLCDPDNVQAQFSIYIAVDWRGMGIGRVLLQKMIGYLRQHGTQELLGYCRSNHNIMRKLANGLGFEMKVLDIISAAALVKASVTTQDQGLATGWDAESDSESDTESDAQSNAEFDTASENRFPIVQMAMHLR